MLNVLNLRRPSAVGPASQSVVDGKDDIPERAELLRELLAPGFFAPLPGSSMDGENGRAVRIRVFIIEGRSSSIERLTLALLSVRCCRPLPSRAGCTDRCHRVRASLAPSR